MTSLPTDWFPGLLTLCVGVLAALVYLFTTQRSKIFESHLPPTPKSIDDIDATYQRLIHELQEHLTNKHLLAPPAWEVEKAHIENLAAEALRTREMAKRNVKRADMKNTTSTMKARWFALIGAVVAFFAALGLSLSKSSTQRVAATPNQKEINLNGIDAVARLALQLMSRQSFTEAKPLLSRAAMIDPYHVKSRVGRAVMRAVEGDVASAQKELERLASRYPEAYDGYLFAGLLALEQKETRRALVQFERYVDAAPISEQSSTIRLEIEQLKEKLAAEAQ